MITKRFYLLALMLATLGCISSQAKKLWAEAFELLPTDISARTNEVLDFNDERCALIKISLPEKEGTSFDGSFSNKYDVSEYWVYAPTGTKGLNLKYPGFDTLTIKFITYGFDTGVEGGSTYRLTLGGYDELRAIVTGEQEFAKGNKALKEGNKREAFNYIKSSAELGYLPAMDSLACMYYQGEGTSRDYSEACKWFRKAAAEGHAGSMGWLGFCYFYGLGVSQDSAKAKEWFERAAAKGNESAKAWLIQYFSNQ